MNDQSYLIFKLNEARYGILATAVQEIFFLPEVTAIADAPPEILGVINLREEFVLVMDLHQRLGQPRPPLKLMDSLVVLEWQTQRVGIIVSHVEAVQSIIVSEQMKVSLYSQSKERLRSELVMGIATIENEMVTLLNPELLVQHANIQAINQDARVYCETNNGVFKQVSNLGIKQKLYDHFDAEARQVIRDRTIALQEVIADQSSAELIPLAVVGLRGEYFGFPLETVHEFTEIHKITPIPCCPPHVVGNINLRGEIVTLIDISDVVDLPMNVVRSRPQAVVVRLDERAAGIAVDSIFDVTYIHPSQITTAPIATQSAKDDYLQGVAFYQDRMMSVINLSKLLTSEVLVVNEEV